MATIKIISNPYKKEIRYQRKTDNREWADIDYTNSPNSKLLSKELTGGFFPFRVKQIVDVIVSEYSIPGEPIELIFEGAADEFQELKDVCALAEYEVQIVAKASTRLLENARDILPEVKRLFQEMSPLILQSISQEKIQRDLSRFADASSDVVPVCVLGNYSAGKSTFINALIGSEILPSGAEPVTAKVYKIMRSKFQDRAQIKFKYLDRDFIIQFSDHETHIITSIPGNPLHAILSKEIDAFSNEQLAQRVCKVLSIVNEYEDSTAEVTISDLIEVEIPFANGVLSRSQHPFVIFDTPGSNSASNAKHLQVLKEAMANMTNGLPIFLCTPDSLDSTDNEALYHIIRDFEELDNRFTMIVVNKADAPGIQRKGATEQEQTRILGQAVPRNLYSGGLFYVSSILGLGAKTDGIFSDYDYEDVFAAQEIRYRDKDNRFYRNLYVFNILPEQIKKRSDSLAADQSDLIYANSGLFSIETEVESFAGKYAAYNKCFQSQMFLRKVIQLTTEKIASDKTQQEGIRQSISEKLEVDKRHLVERLKQASSSEEEKYNRSYSPHMEEFLPADDSAFSAKDLVTKEMEFTERQEEIQGFDTLAREKAEAWKAAREDTIAGIKQGISKLFAGGQTEQREIAPDFAGARDKSAQLSELRHSVDRAAAQDILAYVSAAFEEKLLGYHGRLEAESRAYWTEKTELIRDLLASIVSGSEVLTDAKRAELESIIIKYQRISFPENAAEKIFVKEEFQKGLVLWRWRLWESDHLNLEKLAQVYNQALKDNVHGQYVTISESHEKSARIWRESLLDEIIDNIVDYSPELSKQAKQIQSITKHILELEERRSRLEDYTRELSQMMDWKENVS